ncbi:MAG: formylglycine-generating enzyme family protein [Chitinophagaceae bacterium]|nr:formylglycine-generating enzyme family protein [Chitinophagaceae bacterium]
MRTILFLYFSIILSPVFSQQKKAEIPIGSRAWQKKWASFEPGKWMMKTEVSNGEYREFLDALKSAGKEEEYEFFYPDTAGWKRNKEGNDAYVSYYFSHPSFKNYPVVNITHAAAYDYCMWLNEEYKKLKEKPYGNVEFRLPAHDEWMLAARSGKGDDRIYPWNGMYLRNNKNQNLCNYRSDEARDDLSAGLNDKAFVTAPINSFFPNEIGLYNMSGNVAEMIADIGIAVGGSYYDSGENVRVNSRKNYAKSAPDVGFRVIMVKIED